MGLEESNDTLVADLPSISLLGLLQEDLLSPQ
jgi:hypothetical protein